MSLATELLLMALPIYLRKISTYDSHEHLRLTYAHLNSINKILSIFVYDKTIGGGLEL
jgi:hypothetical protein